MMFSSATRIAKKPKTLQENGKTSGKTENPEDSQECLGPGFSSFCFF